MTEGDADPVPPAEGPEENLPPVPEEDAGEQPAVQTPPEEQPEDPPQETENAGPETNAPAAPVPETTTEETPVPAPFSLEGARTAPSPDAVWSDDFSTTAAPSNDNVKNTWKNGVVPANWNDVWLSPAPTDPAATYWEVVENEALDGGKGIHLHSEDAAARMDIISGVSGLDYSKDYVLRLRVKTQDLSKLKIRAQVGDKGNIALPEGTISGGTQDWYDFEMDLADLQEVYDASDKADKTNENGYLKLEIFSAAGTTGDVWIDRIEIVTKSSAEADKGDILWSNSFDEAVTATGNAAKYFVDGQGPKGMMGAWVPEAPDTDKFQLKLDSETKVDGAYSLYAKSTYPSKPETGTTSNQRIKLAAESFPTDVDYTRDYVLRAKVKLNGASHSNWGGATLRVDIDGTSFTSDRLLGTSDWQTVELPLSAEMLQSEGKTSGKIEPSIMYEYFTGEMWVDDMELIALPYTLELGQTSLTLMQGETQQLTTNAPEGESLTWTSSDETVATVSADGTVTAVGSGVATITATAPSGSSASCTVSVMDEAMESEFAAMRDKWVERLTGNSYWADGAASEEYKTILAGYDEAAQTAQDHLVDNSEDVLFDDLDLDFDKIYGSSSTDSNVSVDYSTAISRIQDMARAWAAKGSRYYQNEELKTDILYAMEWAYDHFYNEKLDNQAMFGNWYHWWIGIPQNLAGAVILMHDEMSPELLQKEAAALQHFNEDPAWVYKVKGAAGKMDMTGGNLADTSLASLLRGAACSDQAAVINGTKYFDQIVKVVTSGEGIYADGSFIQHTNLAYTGGYGATLLNGVEKLVYLTAGSGWSISTDQLGVVYDWIWDGIRPLYANGAMFDMVNGRGVARPSSSDLKTGRGILAAVTLLAESAPADRKAELQGFAKAQLLAGAEAMGESEYYSGMNAAAMMSALKLVNDGSIQAVPNTGYAHVFGGMDKAVAHSDTFSFGISYASGRTGRMEFGNEENKTGWHQSDGATYLYNGDPDQYADNYWNTVDPQRLAGITTDHSTWTLKAWGNYPGNANFNGGTAVGPYATVAMNFENYKTSDNPDLTARKAWFVFDDEIVALGAGITGIDPDRTTETIVENKKIDGGNKLVVDGKETAPDLGDQAELTDVQWAWLAGNTDKDAVGYYFPEGSDVNVLRESRTGKWTDVNGSSGVSDAEVTRNYLSLAIPHGENVNNKLSSYKNEYYDYVLLPGKTQEQVAAYAEDPDIEVLSNSTMAQVVRDNSANVTGYIFWGDQGSKAIRVGDVSAVKGSVTIVKDPAAHTMTVGMADVHQINDSLTFRVYGNGLEVVRCDDGVTAETDKYGVVFTVNTAGAKGKTFTAEVKYRDLTDREKTELGGMRQNYADSQTGNNMADKTDPQYRAVMDRYAEEAKAALEHLNRDAKPGENLFDDIDVQLDWVNKGGLNTDGSANLTNTVSRIQSLALAYTSEGCTGYYHNEDLKEDILFCLDYLQTAFPNFLNYHDKIFANWWDWTIGMPKALSAVGVLMYDELPQKELDWLYNTLRLLVPDSSFYWGRSQTGKGSITTATAANKAEQAMVMMLNGLIGNDSACLFNASDTLADSLKYVTSGEGFYEDGSYKQHGNFAYTGTYGVEMLRGVTQIASITNNTTWACTDADPNIIYEWILNAFRPLYADGGIFDMVQGRSVSRYNRSTITTGRYAMDAILTLIANAPEEYRDELYSFAKTQVQLGIAYDPDSYYAKLRFSSLIMAKNLLADDSIPLDTELYTKVYGRMDKAAVHARNFALAISMFSRRNGATECGNNENFHGWYQSDGALALHNGDQAQYDKGYWASVDPLRLAGITTNHVTKPLDNFSIKGNDRDWVGGSTVPGSNYASVGMDFASLYSDLEAKKSWFAFGEQIVALGAGITTTEGDETETIVENRRLDNENTLIVNGSPAAQTNGQKETVNADWAWLSANQAGTAIGYYFPETTALNVLRETRTGKWSEINSANHPDGADDTVTNDFMSLAVSHGQNPTDGSYSYVLLPGKTQDEMAAYAESNSIRVLANTKDVQAAADTALGVYGFNFWNASSLDLPEGSLLNHVESDHQASVTVWNNNGTLQVAISDPTQQGDTITVTLLGEGLAPADVTGEGTVTAIEGGIQIQVNVNGSYGATVVSYATAPAPQPVPDPGEDPDQDKPSGTGQSGTQTTTPNQPAANPATAAPAQTGASQTTSVTVPQTSDEFPLTALVLTLMCSGLAAGGLFLLHRKRNDR